MPSPGHSGNDFDDILLCDHFEADLEWSGDPTATLSSPQPAIKHEDGGPTAAGVVGEYGAPVANQNAIKSLEEWVAHIFEEISSGKPRFSFDIVSCRKKCTRDRHRRIVWPTKRTPTLKTIAGMLKVAEMAHLALRDDVPTTKRDIFYNDVKLFGKQSTVDTLVDDLAATLGLRRADLNIRASLKGLFCGSALTLTTKQGEVISGLDCEETLIPVGEDIIGINVEEELRWVLVVEKEAVFQALCQLKFTARYPDTIGPGIIVTGKGYPDLATRQLVSSFSEELPIDADPHGLDILSTYKFGSHTMMHENDLLVAPRLEWIGVKRSDIIELGVSQSRLLTLTISDIRKAESLLRKTNPVNLPDDWITELETMLETGTKAEIEVISSAGPRTSGAGVSAGAHALARYVHDKICDALSKLRSDDVVFVKREDSDSMSEFDEPNDGEPTTTTSWSPASSSSSRSKYGLLTGTLEDIPNSTSRQHDSWPIVKEESLDIIDLDFEDDF